MLKEEKNVVFTEEQIEEVNIKLEEIRELLNLKNLSNHKEG